VCALSNVSVLRRLGRRATLAAGALVAVNVVGKGWVRAEDVSAVVSPPPSSAPRPAPPAVAPPRLIVATPADVAEWDCFKRRFVSPEGRVIDTGNGGVSHSEGQGYGLYFAQACDDQAGFDRILHWTTTHLARGRDALHAWRWLPQAAEHVPDRNNATDADLFIAASLSLAARRWSRPDHARAANAIAADVLEMLVREAGGRMVLLPGVQGFEHAEGLTVNPSYYTWPLFDELAALHPSPVWERLAADGLALLDQGRFGPWKLPPDWLQVARDSGALRPHPNWPARFSYDAIRVPLYLAWSGRGTAPAVKAFAEYWARCANRPAWVDLQTCATASYAAPPGMVAVAGIAANTAQSGPKVSGEIRFPQVSASPDYYSGALILLSRLARLGGAVV
jgi:endoglucanase